MNKSNNAYKQIFPIMLLIATLCMGIGYASLNVTLNVSGNAVAISPEGVYITEVNYKSSVNADVSNSEIISGAKTILGSKVCLSATNSTSSITYTVKIYNATSDKYVFTGVTVDNSFYSNSNIEYDVSISNGTIVSSGKSVSFDITFKYVDGYTPTATTNSLESYLNFNFKKCYSVTYENVSGTHVNYAIAGETFSVTFSTTDPLEIKMDGNSLGSSEYTFSNKVLKIPNVTGPLHIRKKMPYTIKNIVTNGSFENGLNGWTKVNSSADHNWHETTIARFGSKAYYRMPSSQTQNYLRQTLSFTKNHVYYFFASAICTSVQPFYADVVNATVNISFNAIPENWRRGSVLYTSSATESRYIHVNFGPTTGNVIVDGIGMVDLTAAFGAGNEPSKSWCDSNITYFDGSKVVYK